MSGGPKLSQPQRLLQRALLLYGRVAKGMTLGVRAVLIKDGHVLLVRHTYVPGLYLPGGGVEAGETVHEAMTREIREEAGAVLTGPARLFGLYRNMHADRRDHVALFVCPDWQQPHPPKVPNLEIAAWGMFPLDALPEDATSASRQRVAEIIEGREPSPDW